MAISSKQKTLLKLAAVGAGLAWIAPKIPLVNSSYLTTGAALYLLGYYGPKTEMGQKLLVD